MEMERTPRPETEAAASREAFQRVWERVEGTGGAESPIEVVPAEEYLPPLLPLPAQAAAGEREEAGRRLQGFIRGELESARRYGAMAARAGGMRRQVLTGLAAEERAAARRLAAAYLLLTGVRYWPEEKRPGRPEPAHLGALRTRVQAARQREEDYRTAAERAEEPMLRALYLELSGGKGRQCRSLWQLLEREISGPAR